MLAGGEGGGHGGVGADESKCRLHLDGSSSVAVKNRWLVVWLWRRREELSCIGVGESV